MERARMQTARSLNIVLCAVGVALVVVTLVKGGGPLALGVVLGVLFVALGVARLRLLAKQAEARESP